MAATISDLTVQRDRSFRDAADARKLVEQGLEELDKVRQRSQAELETLKAQLAEVKNKAAKDAEQARHLILERDKIISRGRAEAEITTKVANQLKTEKAELADQISRLEHALVVAGRQAEMANSAMERNNQALSKLAEVFDDLSPLEGGTQDVALAADDRDISPQGKDHGGANCGAHALFRAALEAAGPVPRPSVCTLDDDGAVLLFGKRRMAVKVAGAKLWVRMAGNEMPFEAYLRAYGASEKNLEERDEDGTLRGKGKSYGGKSNGGKSKRK